MAFSTSSRRAASSRQLLLTEVERLARDFFTRDFFTQSRLEEALKGLVAGEGLPPEITPEMLFSGGIPRIRPVLVLLAAQADQTANLPPSTAAEAAFEAACVAELLQTAIRLHDAALGKQDGRRRRAARRVLREASQWLGGNHVSLRALEIARHLPAPEILGDVLDTLREMAAGQALQEELRHRPATVAEALQHAEDRQGAVFSFSCRAGGRLGGLDRSHVAGLACYGRHIGVAWQLAEDLAVFELPEERVPFLVGTAPVRPVYPVAWAGAKDPEVIRLWSKLKEEPSREEPELCEEELAEALAARVRGNGGLVAGRAAILKQVWSARQALGALPETSARAALDRIAAGIAAPSGLVQAA